MRTISCKVDDDHDSLTVYRVLREQLNVSDATVRRAKQVEGGVTLDGLPVRVNTPAHAGQRVAIAIDAPGLAGSSSDIAPEEGPLDVLHADEDLIVLNKAAGISMYPGPGHPGGTLANYLAWWLACRGRTCGIQAAHRLDAGTSGLVLFATNSFAKERLQGQLHSRSFQREYLALCEGSLHPTEGAIEAPIGLLSQRPNVFGVLPDGKPARTRYRVLWSGRAGGEELSLVRLRLETGRTHQVRIHLAHIGHPLLGDSAYGRASLLIGHPALHSWRIGVDHPVTGERLHFEAPLPADMVALLPGDWALSQLDAV